MRTSIKSTARWPDRVPRHDAGNVAELEALVATMVDEAARFRQLNAELHSGVLAQGRYPRMRQLADQLQKQAQRYATIIGSWGTARSPTPSTSPPRGGRRGDVDTPRCGSTGPTSSTPSTGSMNSSAQRTRPPDPSGPACGVRGSGLLAREQIPAPARTELGGR